MEGFSTLAITSFMHRSRAGTGWYYDTHYGIGDLLIQANDLGPVLRITDDLSAYLKYTVRHEL